MNKVLKLVFFLFSKLSTGWTRIDRCPKKENDNRGNTEKSASVSVQTGLNWCYKWAPGPHHRGGDRVRKNYSDSPVSTSCCKYWEPSCLSQKNLNIYKVGLGSSLMFSLCLSNYRLCINCVLYLMKILLILRYWQMIYKVS